MNLKFLCPKTFQDGEDIADRMTRYFPNLIHPTEVLGTKALTDILQAWDILPRDLPPRLGPKIPRVRSSRRRCRELSTALIWSSMKPVGPLTIWCNATA